MKVAYFRILTAALIFSVELLVCRAAQVYFLREVDPQARDDSGIFIANPYSLASTQMAFGFIIILGSFMYLGMVTGDIETLTLGVLMLTGYPQRLIWPRPVTGKNQNARAALVTEKARLVTEFLVLEAGFETFVGQDQEKRKGEID